MSGLTDDAAEQMIEVMQVWICGILDEIGESPEALRGARTLGNGIIALMDTIKEQLDGNRELMLSTQLLGSIAVIAGVMEKIEEMIP